VSRSATAAAATPVAGRQADYDPLDATPVVPSGVEAAIGRQALAQLRRPLPEQKGLGGWVNRTLGGRQVRVNLDERGTAFWQLIDGERTLAHIERELRRRYNLGAQESRTAVVAFTKMLMQRGLVALRMPEGHPLWQEVKKHE